MRKIIHCHLKIFPWLEMIIRSWFIVKGKLRWLSDFSFSYFCFIKHSICLFIIVANIEVLFVCVSLCESRRHLNLDIVQCFSSGSFVFANIPFKFNNHWNETELTQKLCYEVAVCEIKFHHKEKWWNLFHMHVTIRWCARTISRIEFHRLIWNK